jgi:programmed cell death protein 5
VLELAQSSDAEEERAKRMQQRLQALQIEQQKRLEVKRYLTIGAYERLMNVRVANFELYSQLTDLLISMVQSQRVTGQITEEQLKQILARLTYRKESTIEFKHK